MKRSHKLERIDTGDYTLDQYRHCLYQLGRVGKLLGGDRATLKALGPIASELSTALDVGCGGGFMAQKLASTFPHLTVTGIDLNPLAVLYCQEKHHLANLYFERQAAEALPEDAAEYDLITAHLVCHHMSDEAIVTFLREAYRSARKALLINDLHRHPLAYLSYFAIAPPLFRNRLIWEDGLLSIRRGFTRSDWMGYVAKAEIPQTDCELQWHWPFRWTLLIRTTGAIGST